MAGKKNQNEEIQTQEQGQAQVQGGNSAETIADANVVSNKNPEQNVKLTEAELDAIEIQEQVTAGNQPSGKYKLKDPDTQYADASGFTLAEDQEKELPEDPSPELLARIRSGFIVKA
ncbi:hypothetical protein ACSU64_28025 [Bacillaceae bacterium C204]|uniref:hypothetical protein n=1 Tax=Neobacillus sp. 204 TaxID=3383351 RepID=UPI003978859A